jgi:NADPH:quinone reductase-like Zn-dependent oxidoreductase
MQILVLVYEGKGKQLGQITQLIEAGVIKPVIDKVFRLSKLTKHCRTLKLVGQKESLS